MKNKKFWIAIPHLIILHGMLATACGASTMRSTNQASTELSPASMPAEVTPTVVSQLSTETAVAPTLAVIATSRGPNLEATDPATVRLDSGGLQLIEFFRYT